MSEVCWALAGAAENAPKVEMVGPLLAPSSEAITASLTASTCNVALEATSLPCPSETSKVIAKSPFTSWFGVITKDLSPVSGSTCVVNVASAILRLITDTSSPSTSLALASSWSSVITIWLSSWVSNASGEPVSISTSSFTAATFSTAEEATSLPWPSVTSKLICSSPLIFSLGVITKERSPVSGSTWVSKEALAIDRLRTLRSSPSTSLALVSNCASVITIWPSSLASNTGCSWESMTTSSLTLSTWISKVSELVSVSKSPSVAISFVVASATSTWNVSLVVSVSKGVWPPLCPDNPPPLPPEPWACSWAFCSALPCPSSCSGWAFLCAPPPTACGAPPPLTSPPSCCWGSSDCSCPLLAACPWLFSPSPDSVSSATVCPPTSSPSSASDWLEGPLTWSFCSTASAPVAVVEAIVFCWFCLSCARCSSVLPSGVALCSTALLSGLRLSWFWLSWAMKCLRANVCHSVQKRVF